MALFSNNKKDTVHHEAAKASKEAISTIISKEMKITGKIEFKGKARIDGNIEGDITGEYLVLSESGKVRGNMVLDALICHGTVEGDIKAKLVTAQATAVIIGKLESANLSVESGAVLEGEIKSSARQEASTATGTSKSASTSSSTMSSVAMKKPESGAI